MTPPIGIWDVGILVIALMVAIAGASLLAVVCGLLGRVAVLEAQAEAGVKVEIAPLSHVPDRVLPGALPEAERREIADHLRRLLIEDEILVRIRHGLERLGGADRRLDMTEIAKLIEDRVGQGLADAQRHGSATVQGIVQAWWEERSKHVMRAVEATARVGVQDLVAEQVRIVFRHEREAEAARKLEEVARAKRRKAPAPKR